jgi:hypothetical protein
MSKPEQPQSVLAEELPRWTFERMKTFIATLQRTRNVAAAARSAGMSRRAAYRLRARLPGHPFDRAWAAAVAPRRAFLLMTTEYGAEEADGSHPVAQGHSG